MRSKDFFSWKALEPQGQIWFSSLEDDVQIVNAFAHSQSKLVAVTTLGSVPFVYVLLWLLL